jgi:hypothetical protein
VYLVLNRQTNLVINFVQNNFLSFLMKFSEKSISISLSKVCLHFSTSRKVLQIQRYEALCTLSEELLLKETHGKDENTERHAVKMY